MIYMKIVTSKMPRVVLHILNILQQIQQQDDELGHSWARSELHLLFATYDSPRYINVHGQLALSTHKQVHIDPSPLTPKNKRLTVWTSAGCSSRDRSNNGALHHRRHENRLCCDLPVSFHATHADESQLTQNDRSIDRLMDIDRLD